jgi:hypothetical protein
MDKLQTLTLGGSMKDHTKRPNVVKFFPWWVENINAITFTKEDAIKRLNNNDRIKFLSSKDRLGMIQMIKEHIK